MKDKINIFIKRFLGEPKYIKVIYIIAGVAAALQVYFREGSNNYQIFIHSFNHLINGLSLYTAYPNEYYDFYLYGPSFSLITAPFFYIPEGIGVVLWNVICVLLLIHSVLLLKLGNKRYILVLLVLLLELYGCLKYIQTNPIMLALMIYAFIFFERKKVFWAAFVIMLGFHIKLFSIVVAGLFFFYQKKVEFLGSLVFWGIILAALPLLFIPYTELIFQYQEWIKRLTLDVDLQSSLSLQGLFDAFLGYRSHSRNFIILLLGVITFCIGFIKIKNYKSLKFRMFYLASALIWVVIFNHAAESPTYPIAVAGIAIWYFIQEDKTTTVKALFWIMFFLTILSPTDIFPPYVRNNFIRPYALKALGPSLIWIYIQYQMLFNKQFYHQYE